MKKTLRTLALAALAALPFTSGAQLTIKPVWVNGVQNGVSNPIPGLDAGWTKPVPGNPGTATASRFAVGKDGKVITTSHKDNALVAWDGVKMTTFCTLPEVTAEKWNGTIVTTDDAGNVIINFNFTDGVNSLRNWAVIDNDKNLTEVSLSTPDAELGAHHRIDIMSHIVGDVTSPEGGIGYSTVKNTAGYAGNILMYHFKGDGTKVTSVTAKQSSIVPDLTAIAADTQVEVYQAAPKYLTLDELLSGTPENNFYLPVGVNKPSTNELPGYNDGILANFDGDDYAPLFIGNRGFGSVATMQLDGKKYIVRNYIDPESANASLLSEWKNVMTFGIFTEDGNCVASWEGSTFTNANGSETITVEPVDSKTANIYIYIATSTPDETSGTEKGAYAGMFTVTAGEVAAEPDGSKENPYLIATAEDLCNAYSKTVVGQLVYFKQTADIDMAGVTEYTALTGYDSEYNKSIYYDGDYHIISNFAPVDRIAGTGANAYYDTTIFGTPSGTIKNLGIVDAKIETDWFEAGILGGFAGTAAQTATAAMNIDNVFVTGSIVGKTGSAFSNAVAGGMFGTSGQPLNITNSYVQVEIEGPGYAAGFISKAAAATNITNSYASASVKGATTALAVACDPANPADITFNNVIAFGTGEAANVPTVGAATVVPAFDATGIASIQAWEAFNKKDLFNGLPALNWQNNSGAGIFDAEIDNSDAPAVYYNLQGVEVANPDNGVYIVRRGNKVTKELIRK